MSRLELRITDVDRDVTMIELESNRVWIGRDVPHTDPEFDWCAVWDRDMVDKAIEFLTQCRDQMTDRSEER